MADDRSSLFLSTASAFAQIVRLVGDDDWVKPGLGVWDVRALVGHTSRAIETVALYLALDAPPTADFETAQDYFAALVGSADKAAADDGIARRGTEQGRAMGDDPAASVDALIEAAESALTHQAPTRLVASRLGTVALDEYLRTRIFELVVHGLDVLHAIDSSARPLPPEAVTETLVLAAQTAAATGRAEQLLFALTGRAALPVGFSVV